MRLVLYLSSPERLAQVPFAVAGVFNRYMEREVRGKLRAAGFARIECQTVARKGKDTYFFSAWK